MLALLQRVGGDVKPVILRARTVTTGLPGSTNQRNELCWVDDYGHSHAEIAGIKPQRITDRMEVRVIEPDPQRVLPLSGKGREL